MRGVSILLVGLRCQQNDQVKFYIYPMTDNYGHNCTLFKSRVAFCFDNMSPTDHKIEHIYWGVKKVKSLFMFWSLQNYYVHYWRIQKHLVIPINHLSVFQKSVKILPSAVKVFFISQESTNQSFDHSSDQSSDQSLDWVLRKSRTSPKSSI